MFKRISFSFSSIGLNLEIEGATNFRNVFTGLTFADLSLK